jgi:hypothetical protein
MPQEIPNFMDLIIRDITGNEWRNQYNTTLSPVEEAIYRRWAGERLMDEDNYDLRGYFLNEARKGEIPIDEGHLVDTYKKPNHPTFSNQSRYSRNPYVGGEWQQTGLKNYAFIPSEWNKRVWPREFLEEYFSVAEPDAELWYEGPAR